MYILHTYILAEKENATKKYYSDPSANMVSYNIISHNMMFQFGSEKIL